jgi:hypothetical protein
MNHRQKIGYTILGAFIMLIGMWIGNSTSPPLIAQSNRTFGESEKSEWEWQWSRPVTAQSNGTFGEIQCTGLTVVDEGGNKMIELKSSGLGGAINLYNLGGQVMMSLDVSQVSSEINLFHKSFGASADDDSETPTLGIEIDSGPGSNWLQVGNRNRTGGIFMHNTEGFSELNVYHRNGKGGTVLYSSEEIHSLSIYDAYHGKSGAGLSSKKLIGLGSYGGSPELVISDKDETEVVRLP